MNTKEPTTAPNYYTRCEICRFPLWLTAICLLMNSHNSPAATFTVSRLAGSGPGSLPVAIAQANATAGDHTIEFSANGTIRLFEPLPTISKNLTINGREMISVVADPADQIGLFSIGAGTTNVIAGITIMGGYRGSGDGAAISNAGTLVVDKCMIVSNEVNSGRGGAIFSSGPLSIINSTLRANEARNGGGAVWCSEKLSVIGCSFVTNWTRTGHGGAVYCGNEMEMSGTMFTGNWIEAAGNGGGVHSLLSVKAENSEFTHNRASFGIGGAIFAGAGILDLVSSVLRANVASNAGAGWAIGGLRLVKSEVSDNVSSNLGGAFHSSGEIHVSQTILSGNLARKGGALSLTNATVVVESSTVANNAAVGDASEIFFSHLALGGGIYGVGSSLAVSNSTISGNTAVTGRSHGGGIFLDGGSAAIVSSTIVSNQAGSWGGGIESSNVSPLLLSSVVAANSGGLKPNLSGDYASLGFNLIGDNRGASGLSINDFQNELPNVGPLQENGGLTKTHALLPGSLAIGFGASTGIPAIDQRGAVRPPGQSDIGAFQLVTKLNPSISWNNPNDIVYGTALDVRQLNAVANVPGAFSYTPPAGTLLDAGVGQVLSVSFTPDDLVSYQPISRSVTINVLKAPQGILFNGLPNRQLGDAPFLLSAMASSGLPVTFRLLSGPAFLVGNAVTLANREGTVVVRAEQAGDSNRAAATPVDRSFYLGSPAFPVITQQPEHQIAAPGTRVEFSVAADGAPLSYQWQFRGSNLPGETNPTLVLHRADPDHAGPYNVIVGNSGGTVVSKVVLLTVAVAPGAPAITAHPISQSIETGSSATLTVSASGTGLTYQWYQGLRGNTNSPVASATSATFTTPPLTQTQSYWVLVRNSSGITDSHTATISVGQSASAATLEIAYLAGLTVNGTNGANYRIEYTTEAASTNWLQLTNISLSGSSFRMADWSSTNATKRFYRAVSP